MEIGVIGAGNIGGNAARQFARAGLSVVLSFSRHPASLMALTQEIGALARLGTPVQAAACDVVMISVPWDLIDDAMAQAGSLEGKVVIDTTNQFTAAGAVKLPDGQTAAQFNAARMRGSRYTKSFNTLTAGFQAAAALRPRAEPAVQWIAGDDAEAKGIGHATNRRCRLRTCRSRWSSHVRRDGGPATFRRSLWRRVASS